MTHTETHAKFQLAFSFEFLMFPEELLCRSQNQNLLHQLKAEHTQMHHILSLIDLTDGTTFIY